MPFHVLFVAEAFEAHVAGVRPLAGVFAEVRPYQAEGTKRLVAVLAFVRAKVPVHLHVANEGAFVLETHVASVAAERSVRRVAFYMSF